VRIVSADAIGRAVSYVGLADALAEAFRAEVVTPVRHHHTITRPGRDATLLLMPAWTTTAGGFLGCKLVTVFPDNAKLGSPSLHGLYVLLSGETGEPLAMLDGRALTAWRTAAASALAARYLARADASHLLMWVQARLRATSSALTPRCGRFGRLRSGTGRGAAPTRSRPHLRTPASLFRWRTILKPRRVQRTSSRVPR